METILVTAIVLVSTVVVIRHLRKIFSTPGKNRCSGGCCGCSQAVPQKENI
ncbi:MAG: FeoB-associated Cys-rich membrane protein [Desulfuromonadaceae bacterium]|nr:FeoB-associated Cys-rich membrane protein [Desulfuromonadaceae bacterium]